MDGIKIAVIGVGRWGVNHVRVLTLLRREGLCSEVVICDVNKLRVKEIAKKFGIEKIYFNINDLLKSEKLDAAIIAVPTIYHFEIATKLIKHAHLLIEKPIASTLEEAKEIINLARRYGRIIQVGHILRFHPLTDRVKKLINDKLQDVLFINTERLGPGGIPSIERAGNLGVCHDLLIHDIDLCCYFLGMLPRNVFAHTVKVQGYPYEVSAFSIFNYDNNIFTTHMVSWITKPDFKSRLITIQFTDSKVYVDYILQKITFEKTSSFERKYVENFVIPNEEPLMIEDRHFIECIRWGRKPCVNEIDGYIALKCIIYALKASERGVKLEIPWDENFITEMMK